MQVHLAFSQSVLVSGKMEQSSYIADHPATPMLRIEETDKNSMG